MEGLGLALNQPNAVVRSDGTFSFPEVSPGRYRVALYSGGNAGYLKSVKFSDIETVETGFDVAGGAKGLLEITVSLNGGTVSGTVKNADGRPVTDIPVTLIPDASSTARTDLYRASYTDDNGQFTIGGIAPGKYRIFAWESIEPNQQFDPDFLRLHEKRGQEITVSENASQPIELKQITAADLTADQR